MKIAALDLGSNSFLCLICRVERGKIIEVLYDKAIITRLGKNVQKEGVISRESLLRASEAFLEFKRPMENFGVEKVVAVTTSAAREATNFSDLKLLGEEHGIPIDLISGEKEARYSFLGATDKSQNKDSLILDIGGGSTEIAYYEDGELKLTSLPIGSVRLGDMFVEDWTHLNSNVLEKMKKQALQSIEVVWEQSKPPKRNWVAVAGTPTSLRSIQEKTYDPQLIHETRLTLGEVSKLKSDLLNMELKNRRKLPGLDPKRADVIPVGAMILETVMEWAEVEEVTVSVRGLRYGLALSESSS